MKRNIEDILNIEKPAKDAKKNATNAEFVFYIHLRNAEWQNTYATICEEHTFNICQD